MAVEVVGDRPPAHEDRLREPTNLAVVSTQPAHVPELELARDLVAVLYAASAPIAISDVARVLGTSIARVEQLASSVMRHPPLGLALQRQGELLQLTTAPAAAPAVERYLGAPPPVRLSRAALEVLAVVVYRQPTTRGEIEAVRGVNSDSAVATLLARGLIAEVGRREVVGRPALLATTPELLSYLGLSSLDELPPLPGTLRDALDRVAPSRA